MYTPIIKDKYVLFAAQGTECPVCKKIMVEKVDRNGLRRSFFPFWFEMCQDAQMKRANIVYVSNTKVDDDNICIECEKSGKADFKCELCGERKPTSKIKESFGDPPDYLCDDCYKITPAKTWDDKCDELEQEHRYDYQ